ncbi:hypothetical protein F4778DRAFT_173197 [Xylariomycetidae sp. FL2044]|nr:hypothetical protein F4778DRAFT_173197 [Xylariomycetidae sp. FL2044]
MSMLVMDDKPTSNMESAAIPRSCLDVSFPLGELQRFRRLSGLTEPSKATRKASDSGTLGLLCVSSPARSSFGSCTSSRDSVADSCSTISTEPPSPQTPRPKTEPLDDCSIAQVDWTSRRGSIKRKYEDGEEEDVKKVKLPSLHHEIPDERPRQDNAEHRVKRQLQTPSCSPEPSKEYIFSRPPTLATEDPITRSLNILRKARDSSRDLLPGLHDLAGSSLNIALDFTPKQPIFYRTPPPHYAFPQSEKPLYVAQHQPSPPPPTKGAKKERARPKEGHCNIKYTTEETDYIRYQKTDLKQPWAVALNAFQVKYCCVPGQPHRQVQGIQGCHYRQHTHIPDRDRHFRKLRFLPNGHIKAVDHKIRSQGDDKRVFGLLYLYPERAMHYDWVSREDREFAAQLYKERIPQIEAARRDAMERGTWVERDESGRCTCCPKPDRERDVQKQRRNNGAPPTEISTTPDKKKDNSNNNPKREHAMWMPIRQWHAGDHRV